MSSCSSGNVLRVSHVMGKMLGGGVESVVMNYYRHINRDLVQFDFLVDSDSSRVPYEEILSLGGRVFEVPPYQQVVPYSRSVESLCRREAWPIVHSHINALSVFPLRAARSAGVPVRIAHSHSTSGKGEHARNVAKAVLKRLSNIYPTHRLACSHYAGKWLFGGSANYEVLPNAIDLDRFVFNAKDREAVRKSLGISPETFVMGHIGRFTPQKNHGFLVDVFKVIASLDPTAVLVLGGEGALLKQTKEKVCDLGLSNRVLFLGQRNDAYKLYQAFDVFALPSIYEGLGLVAIEAQSAGLPCCLSSRVPGEAQVLSETILLPLEGGSEVWADNILSMKHKPRYDTRKQMREAGFDIAASARWLEAYYLVLSNLMY